MPELVPILFGAFFPLAGAYLLGSFCLKNVPAPHSIRLATGAAISSHLVFLLMAAGLATTISFTLLGVLLLLPAMRFRHFTAPALSPLDGVTKWLTAAVLSVYGVLYLVHTLAPEIQPDGVTYHLGLVAQWMRAGGFTDRVSFYEMLPQGLEMLFAFAYAFGSHSAAKLVHFAFLATTVPLLFAAGRRLELPGWTSAAAAVFYICTPVVGISGTATYNDAALVFFLLATFYLLCAWVQDNDDRCLLPAGLTAGFCYSIKLTGLIAAPLALIFVVSRRRWKAPLLFAAGAFLMIAPWMARNTLMAGNPLAPLFNQFFPNPHFHISTERYLADVLRNYGGVTAAGLPLEVTVRGFKLQGLIGPLFLLAPLALVALRRRAGRIVWLLAALMALPWMFNFGTRFLMPALVFVSLALAMSLPRPLAWACMVFHAVSCWPAVGSLYEDEGAWRLRGFPWRAAIRLEAETDYLDRVLWEYEAVRLVNRYAAPGEAVLDLAEAPAAYIRSTTIGPWQSAAGDRMVQALRTASVLDRGTFTAFEASWPKQAFTALRFRQTASGSFQWGIYEVQLYLGDDLIQNRRHWQLGAWPNVWDAPLAFDRNLISRWATWEPVRPGMHLDVYFGPPVLLTSARLICARDEDRARVRIYGRSLDGSWRLLSPHPLLSVRSPLNLRRSAARILRREGIRYILTPVSNEGYGLIGRTLTDNAGDWGAEPLGHAANIYLLRIR